MMYVCTYLCTYIHNYIATDITCIRKYVRNYITIYVCVLYIATHMVLYGIASNNRNIVIAMLTLSHDMYMHMYVHMTYAATSVI